VSALGADFEPQARRYNGNRHSPRSTCSNNPRHASLWAFRAESAQEINNQAYRENQAKPAAADDRTAKVKPAAAEQEKTNKYD
jgi:hypothetical protein